MFVKRLAHDKHGDTIVEVLIALAILGLAFSISFATANRSLTVARNAEEHSEALQYLDSQVELARVDAGDASLYTENQSLCMDTVPNDVNYGKPVPATSIVCNISSLYKLSYTYSQAKDINNIPQDIFTFTVAWDGVGSLGAQQEQISYKIHKLTGATAANLTPSTPPPTLTFTSSPSPANVNTGQSVQLTWSTTDATSCTASGAWSGAQTTSNSIPQTFFSTGTYNYGLTCSGPSGTTPTQTITVTVTPPPPPLPTLNFCAYQSDVSTCAPTITIPFKTGARLLWSTTNATTCTASGANPYGFWSGSVGYSGNRPTGTLNYTPTTFKLTCSGPGGSTATQSVIINVSGAPPCTALLQSAGQC